MSEIELVDLDNVEIVAAVERAFRIKITDAEAGGCATVGDFFDVITRKVQTVDRGAPFCPTASAFWRLRTALRNEHPSRKVTPATPLAELLPASRRSAWWERLGRSSGMDMPSFLPPLTAGRPWWAKWALGFVASGIAFACGAGAWSGPVGVAVVVLSGGFGSSRASEVIGMGAGATVGDLAKITASLNPGLLAGPSSLMRSSEVWTALEGVLRNFTGYSGPIEKRTRFRCV